MSYMLAAKSQSIRLSAEDVTILEEILRRTGFLGYSDAMRFALRQYAKAEGIGGDVKPRTTPNPTATVVRVINEPKPPTLIKTTIVRASTEPVVVRTSVVRVSNEPKPYVAAVVKTRTPKTKKR